MWFEFTTYHLWEILLCRLNDKNWNLTLYMYICMDLRRVPRACAPNLRLLYIIYTLKWVRIIMYWLKFFLFYKIILIKVQTLVMRILNCFWILNYLSITVWNLYKALYNASFVTYLIWYFIIKIYQIKNKL